MKETSSTAEFTRSIPIKKRIQEEKISDTYKLQFELEEERKKNEKKFEELEWNECLKVMKIEDEKERKKIEEKKRKI
uniref:Uncharacterized protein n=1 Tax=Coptotermes formosanus TaxID=36987 RepID=R4V527_COPFO|nr:hypothetical protein [Coptotermes formosanus]